MLCYGIRINITRVLTISSLAMTIFRAHYYDEQARIYIPSVNADSFIRAVSMLMYVYIPYGKNLLYYDVNSL